MKVLVLGTGTPGLKKHAGHDFTFSATPGKNESIPSLSGYELALFHLGDDADDFAGVLDDWDGRNELAKVIAFSGGLQAEKSERLRKLGNIPFISAIHDDNDVLRLNWAAIPEDSTASARELAERLKNIDAILTALYILCQGFLLMFLRPFSDGTGYEVPAEEGEWSRVGKKSDVESIKNNLKRLRLDSPTMRKEILPSADGGIAYWSSVCTKLPACNSHPCVDPAACDIGKWLRDEFGPLEMEYTRKLIHEIRSGTIPSPVVVAESSVELARLHQVIPVIQSQEPR